ncbi:MAG TPA: hypothetical protein VLE91_02820 [Candidatus Saccharimonadales bacterium]|nr:hypothetical protein [Candidatus Saccharimonadales bacterium]
MSTLTQAALVSKKAFFWTLIIFAIVIAVLVFLGIGKSIKQTLFPPAPTPALVAFGKLPKVDLSGGFVAPASTYEAQTISGNFSVNSTSAKVFKIFSPTPSFSDTANLRAKVEALGFDWAPTTTADGSFKFTKQGKSLTINQYGNNFTLETDYAANSSILSSNPGDVKAAIDTAYAFFSSSGLDLENYPKDKIETRTLKIDGSTLSATTSTSGANLVEVTLNYGDLDKLPVIWAKKNPGGIYALVWQGQVVFAKVVRVPILKNEFSTYTLRPVTSAYEDLKNGLGFFNTPLNSGNNVVLNASLGYVIGDKTGDYLQPVYIFKLANGVLGYVSAVDNSWISTTSGK